MNHPADNYFHFPVRFADGISGEACGFSVFPEGAVKSALEPLETVPFFCPEETSPGEFLPGKASGHDIDARFASLLEDALARAGLMNPGGKDPGILLAAFVRAESADGPCGGIIGIPGTAPGEDPDHYQTILHFRGEAWRIILFPGTGAVLYLEKEPDPKDSFYVVLSALFPRKGILDLLNTESDRYLYALDYLEGDPVLTGRCGGNINHF